MKQWLIRLICRFAGHEWGGWFVIGMIWDAPHLRNEVFIERICMNCSKHETAWAHFTEQGQSAARYIHIPGHK
jgi:hypothetical protein